MILVKIGKIFDYPYLKSLNNFIICPRNNFKYLRRSRSVELITRILKFFQFSLCDIELKAEFKDKLISKIFKLKEQLKFIRFFYQNFPFIWSINIAGHIRNLN